MIYYEWKKLTRIELANFLKKTEEKYGEFKKAEVVCSEESRRRLARIGKAMLHHSEEIQRRRKKGRGEGWDGREEMGDEIFFFLIYVGFCRTKSFLVNVLWGDKPADLTFGLYLFLFSPLCRWQGTKPCLLILESIYDEKKSYESFFFYP